MRIKSQKANALTGSIKVPGDKSISHRILIMEHLMKRLHTDNKVSVEIEGLLESEDVQRTKEILKSIHTKDKNKKEYHFELGNSGTSARLLMGVLAGSFGGLPNSTITFTGDKSLSRRPMGRVIKPLTKMGCTFISHGPNALPLTMITPNRLTTLKNYSPEVFSAQVKGCLLFASMSSRDNGFSFVDNGKTRDHTERMMKWFGQPVDTEDGIMRIPNVNYTFLPESYETGSDPKYKTIRYKVPGDFSSAAFFIVAALITEGSNLEIRDVGINPYRTGLLNALWRMGANIELKNIRSWQNEPVADITVKYSELTGIEMKESDFDNMIDEFPIFCIAAAFAKGNSSICAPAELRVKESDRLQEMINGLTSIGISTAPNYGTTHITIADDGIQTLDGHIKDAMDHRIAMSFAIAGLRSSTGITVDAESITTSFPNFIELLNTVGGNITNV